MTSSVVAALQALKGLRNSLKLDRFIAMLSIGLWVDYASPNPHHNMFRRRYFCDSEDVSRDRKVALRNLVRYVITCTIDIRRELCCSNIASNRAYSSLYGVSHKKQATLLL